MTPPGTVVYPSTSDKEQRLLEVKYSIFQETIAIQRKWREQVEDALAAR